LQNIGVVLPKPGYLQGLMDLCEHYGAVCVFDEVKTGFRSGLGGYQGVVDVQPHLSVFGKAVANGYPMGVIGGKREIMQLFDMADPKMRVLIAGTYNAHPMNTAAAIATLGVLGQPGVYAHLDAVSERLYNGLEALFEEKGIAFVLSRNRSAFCLYFMDEAPADLHDILYHHDFDFDILLRKAWIKNGIYQIPIACKQGSVSYAHSNDDIDETLHKTRKILASI
jgi:glutamate-1-semialdehyde 2,1-aminomutase